MKPSLIILAAVSAAALVATPAMAGGSRHKHYCNCGHKKSSCGSSSSTSTSSSTGGTTTSSTGGTSSSSSSSSGGTSTSSGGTPVPEPGVMGMMGLSLVALGVARQRQRRRAA